MDSIASVNVDNNKSSLEMLASCELLVHWVLIDMVYGIAYSIGMNGTNPT